MPNTRKLLTGLVFSIVLHVGLAFVFQGALFRSEVATTQRETEPMIADVEVFDLHNSTRKAAAPRDGSRVALNRKSDTFFPARTNGSSGRGRSRPSEALVVGDDLDHLRFQPYDHQFRNSPARKQSSSSSTTIDNDDRKVSPDSSRPRFEQHPLIRAPITPRGPRASTRDEALSKLSKENYLSNESQVAVVAKSRGQPADRDERQRASSKRLTDLYDAAKPDDQGEERGADRGALAGRKGSPGGKTKGLPVWLDTTDTRYVPYFREIYRKIQPLWRFPKDLAVKFEQGDVLVQFSVSEQGQLTHVSVKKPSGYPRFDQNAIAAIRGAAPFPPIPSGLGKSLEILAPFEFHNPMIR